MDDHASEMAAVCLAHHARMAARALNRFYDDALRPTGLKGTQVAVLVAAGLGQGQLTITRLADKLGLERSTLSRNLEPLERRGLILVGPETQHRARSVELTPRGRALLAEAEPYWRDAQAKAAAHLGDQWRDTLQDLSRLAELR